MQTQFYILPANNAPEMNVSHGWIGIRKADIYNGCVIADEGIKPSEVAGRYRARLREEFLVYSVDMCN